MEPDWAESDLRNRSREKETFLSTKWQLRKFEAMELKWTPKVEMPKIMVRELQEIAERCTNSRICNR
jgi:hypothetical protein